MSIETGYCNFPLCQRKAEKNGYCVCHKIYSDTPAEKKAPYKIPNKSANAKKTDRKLKKIVDDLKLINPACQLKTPVCTGYAQGSDHIVKRSPKNVTDKNNIVLACNACNSWKEANSKKAKEMGISKSKFTPISVTVIDHELKAIILEEI